MYVRAFDGTEWGAWDRFDVTTVSNTAPVATINDQTIVKNRWYRVSQWLGYSDANGDPPAQYIFMDTNTAATSAYFWTPDVGQRTAQMPFVVNAADINDVWIRAGSASGTDAMRVTATDGTTQGPDDAFNITTVSNTGPVATINDQTVIKNRWYRVSQWLSYSDANGDAPVQYTFMDINSAATSAYFWTPDIGQHPAQTPFTVSAADINNVWIRGGTVSGTDAMRVTAFDGTDQGPDDAFNITTVSNTPPVATINDQTIVKNRWYRVSQWLSYTDANGDPAVQYEFQDTGTASTSAYFWTPDVGQQPAGGVSFVVNASDINNVWIRGASVGGTDLMRVRAFDGTDWGPTDDFNITSMRNALPVATVSDQTVVKNHWYRVSQWLNYSDADGDPATQYMFFDVNTAAGSAYFWTPDVGQRPAQTAFIVSAADIGNVWIRGGSISGTDAMRITAFDGTDQGPDDAFDITTVSNTPLVATINDQTVIKNRWYRVSQWLSVSGANGDPATQYMFMDTNTASTSAYFWTPDVGQRTAQTPFVVNAADINTSGSGAAVPPAPTPCASPASTARIRARTMPSTSRPSPTRRRR